MRSRLILIPIVVSIILGAATLTRGHEWGDDFASYIMQAGSIWNGTTEKFVEHNSFTIFESSNQIGPVAYPWGYPLILSPVYSIKGIHPLALKLPGLLFYAGFLICLYLLMKSRLTPIENLLLVSVFAFNPLLIQFLDQILSDIPFLFFSTLALLLITDKSKRNDIHSVAIGMATFLAFFIRTTGALLLASFIALELIKTFIHRTDREAVQRSVRAVLVSGAVFGILWLVSILLFPSEEFSHLARYQEFNIKTAFQFAAAYFQVFGDFFGTAFDWKIIYYIVLIFFLIGAWAKRKEEPLFIIFFLLWMLLLITWPAWQGARFIFPLLPIFIYFAFQGMKFAFAKLPEKHMQTGRWAFNSFWVLIVGAFLFTASANAYANLQNNRAINGPFDTFSNEVYNFIEAETPSNSIIVFFKPRAMRLMTGHDTIMSTECDRMLKGDYIVLSRKVGANQQIPPESIDTCHLPLQQVLKNDRFIVYQIQK